MPILRIHVTAAEAKRIARMAARSDVPPEQWARGALVHAVAVDEGHWRELDERERLRRDADRTQFARLSHHLRGLPEGTIDALVEALVLERQQGRREGSASAVERLAVARATKGGS